MNSLSSPLLQWPASVCPRCYLRQQRALQTAPPLIRQCRKPTNSLDYRRHHPTQTRVSHPQNRTNSLTSPLLINAVRRRPRSIRSFSSTHPINSQYTQSTTQISVDSPIDPTLFRPRRRSRSKSLPSSLQPRQVKNVPNIRSRLRQWQRVNAEAQKPFPELVTFHDEYESNEMVRPDSFQTETRSNLALGRSFGAEDDEELTGDFTPGDLVDHTGPESSVFSDKLSIFVGRVSHEDYFYTVNGNLRLFPAEYASFRVRNFVSEHDLDPIRSYLPKAKGISAGTDSQLESEILAPYEVGAILREKMQQFQNEADSWYRTFSSALDSTHEIVADMDNSKLMAVEDIASKLTGIPRHLFDTSQGPPHYRSLLWLVTRSILTTDLGYEPVNRVRLSQHPRVIVDSVRSARAVHRTMYAARCLNSLKTSEAIGHLVDSSTRQGAQPLISFLKKCQDIVSKSAHGLRTYTPHGAVVGSKNTDEAQRTATKLEEIKFNTHDRDFIRFLFLAVNTESIRKYSGRVSSIPYMMLKEIKPTLSIITEENIYALLVEIGVMQPFEQPFAYDRIFAKPEKSLVNEVDVMGKRFESLGNLEDATDMRDTMQGLRKDWQDLPVYCIDRTTTRLLDDAFSIERVEDQTDQYWVHVHIAHISAFCNPNDTTGRLARSKRMTEYFSTFRLPMLPNWLGESFSLQKDAAVLTFSVRLSSSGQVLERKIQPGIVRNVVRYTPTDLEDAMYAKERVSSDISSEQREEQDSSAEATASPQEQPIAEEHLADLIKLDELMNTIESLDVDHQWMEKELFGEDSRVRQLLKSRAPKSAQPVVQLAQGQVRGAPLTPMANTPEPLHPVFKLNSPIPFLDRNGSSNMSQWLDPSSGKLLVSLVLRQGRITAAEVAARKGVPMIFSGVSQLTRHGQQGLMKILQSFGDQRRWDDEKVEAVVGWLMNSSAAETRSTQPVLDRGHEGGYSTSITSPLRKYSDLVGCWQIDAMLHEDARARKSTGALDSEFAISITPEQTPVMPYSDPSFLPFPTTESLNEVMFETDADRRGQKRFQRLHNAFWQFRAFAEAFYSKSDEIPNPLTAKVRFITGARGVAVALEGIPMLVICPFESMPADKTVEMHDRWEVEVTELNFFKSRVYVKLVKKLEDAQGRKAESESARPMV